MGAINNTVQTIQSGLTTTIKHVVATCINTDEIPSIREYIKKGKRSDILH